MEEPKIVKVNDRKGIQATIAAILGVLVLFVGVSIVGSPIKSFRTPESSISFAVAMYLPILIVCVLVLRRTKNAQ
ncbi:MAG: hypothetical protein HYU39_08825 [Thaumarchaeota archaeon]|nr:hypothetical protein [Nitrososphaerota archaeon]